MKTSVTQPNNDKDRRISIADRIGLRLGASERRSAARKQKEALFYSSGERKRMQAALYLIGAIALLSIVVNLGGIAVLTYAVTAALHQPVVGLMEHDDGRPTTVIGELSPLHADATANMLQWNAEHYIQDLETRASFNQLTINKDAVLKRTAAGTEAQTFVEQTFAKSFSTYQHGDVEPQHIDCRAEGEFQGPTKKMRFDCYYELVPVDGADAALAANNAALQRPRFLSHVEIAQVRGLAKYVDFLYANPDEVLVSYIDQESLDSGTGVK